MIPESKPRFRGEEGTQYNNTLKLWKWERMANASRQKEEKFNYLEENFVFYGSYHNDAVNQMIHICFVWPILISALVLISYIPGVHTSSGIDVDLSLVITAYYSLTYAIIELPGFAGLLASGMVIGCHFLAHYLKSDAALGASAWEVSLVIHITSWLAQFYGHAFHEGRSPALLSNLYQALVMAPLFVLMEVLFKIGYRPNFRLKCQRQIDKNIENFNYKLKKSRERNLR